MQLTEKAIRCQELGADMILHTWNILQSYYDWTYHTLVKGERKKNNCIYQVWVQNHSDYTNDEDMLDSYKIIWHPLNRWRLCYLYMISNKTHRQTLFFDDLWNIFDKNHMLYNQTILDRQHNDELMDAIEEFLFSLK